MSAVVTRREMMAWALAIVLAVTVVVTVSPDDADAGAGPTTGVVFLATGANFPDALGAGPAAALGIGPILLVNQNSVPQATLDELNRLQPDEIFIVGGAAVISEGVKSTLEGLSFGPTVTRLAGANRFETAAAVSGAIFPHAGFLGASDKAADSNLLDGKDSTAFLGASDKAADSNLLDGNDSSAFLMPSDVVAAHAEGDQSAFVTSTDQVVRSVSLTAPSAGVVVVNSSANALEPTAGDAVRCSITTGTSVDNDFYQWWESPGTNGDTAQLAGTRGFDVAAGPITFNLVCEHSGSSGASFVEDSALTAIFIPSS